jgi:uncharacterized Zn finger protein
MKLLRCPNFSCRGECEIIGNERAINKKIRCLNCGFNNLDEPAKKEPEVIIRRRERAHDDTNQ